MSATAGTGKSGKPYVLISTDCHAGADIGQYKPYLDRRWHDEFDAWAATYADAWGELDADAEYKAGVASFLSPINWESDARLAMLEEQGVAAEVLFPNTAPPFSPGGALTSPTPRTAAELEYRSVGVQAHNRWLRDFCAAVPGRRLGLVQIYLDDVDAAVAEVQWAKEAGLSGVLLPPDHHLRLQTLYDTELDRLWAVCADLQLPVHRHGIAVGSDEVADGSLPGARACGVYESFYFGRRSLFQMILSGVLERHPTLQFVLTEVGGSGWLVHELLGLDRFVTGARVDGTINAVFAADAVASLSKLPSEYFRDQCFISTLVARGEVKKRAEIGLDQILWGVDFPHHEGTVPYALETLRACMYDVPEDEVRRMTSLNAARVYDVDLDRLQVIADRIGPTVEEIATPLLPAEIPDDPEFRLVSGIRA